MSVSNSTTWELNSTTWSVSLNVTLRALGGRELELWVRELAALVGLGIPFVGGALASSDLVDFGSENVKNLSLYKTGATIFEQKVSSHKLLIDHSIV